MSKHRKLWVVIADGEHARIVVPAAAAGSFQTHAGFDAQTAHKRSAELGADRPGRSFESGGNTRHAIAPKHDLKALEKQKFEHFIGDCLNEASAHVAFDRLVLVAPARALNEIRERLDQTTAGKLVGTLAKDLTKVPDHALSQHLADWAQPSQQENR